MSECGTYVSSAVGAGNLSLDFLANMLNISSKSCILLNHAHKVSSRGHQRLISHVVNPHVGEGRLQAVAALLADTVLLEKSALRIPLLVDRIK